MEERDREEERWKKNEREADKGVSQRGWETDKDIEKEQEPGSEREKNRVTDSEWVSRRLV